MSSAEPDWLLWAREVQATAQTGLAFTRDPYDRERYEALQALAARMLAARTDGSAEAYATLFAAETGYATPKIDVRGAVFDAEGRILMVREVMDSNRWTLPGGWADVSQTPSQSAVREVFEETGYHARAVKLAAVWDRAAQGHANPGLFSIVKHFFLCELTGGDARTSLETSEVAFFAEDDIPLICRSAASCRARSAACSPIGGIGVCRRSGIEPRSWEARKPRRHDRHRARLPGAGRKPDDLIALPSNIVMRGLVPRTYPAGRPDEVGWRGSG